MPSVPLGARRRQLLGVLVVERNRRHAADPALHEGIDAHLRWLEDALATIERDLDGAVRESAVWRMCWLTVVPGLRSALPCPPESRDGQATLQVPRSGLVQ